ncbi:MAG: hypothetical protein K9M45_05715 [Kiritimatiellales bacterium]|nr:hypothetical protein [Kiritimatiellales bacterium]
MNRRCFQQAVMAAGTLGAGRVIGADNDLDRFGGWTARKFKPTGFFRTEQDADRWWLVTPEGNAFLSFGINHLEPSLWQQDYNRDAWEKRLGVKASQYKAFCAALRSWYLETCEQYGFNTAGVHTSLQIINTPEPALPYIQKIMFVDLPHWKPEIPDENFVDVFAPAFERHCDKLAKKSALPAREDPFLLGYAMTDCTLFTEEDCRERPDVIGGARRKFRIGWPRRLRNLPGDAPGKQAYVKLMRELYRGRIGEFNQTYGTTFDSFDALASAVNWRPHTELSNANETRDNIRFLHAVIDRYYATAKSAIRRYDANHMFFGDKLNANTDSADTVLPITSKYTDLVYYQMYGRYEIQKPGLDRWSRLTGKALINGDASYTMVTEHMPRPYGPVADNLEQRAEWTEEFFRSAFSRPDFVGWHYCGLIDATNENPRKKDRQHSGLLDSYGNPYTRLEKALKACSEQKYAIALGG